MMVVDALASGIVQAVRFFWDSLFGLIFGFLISAVVQVVLTPADMQRYLGPNLRGITFGALFGIISSSCSYGASAAARGFYQRGADVRSAFSFLISSTNMNLAILILFWSLLGWKFAFAEFFGGVIIIAVVSAGFTVLFRNATLERMQREYLENNTDTRSIITECPLCGMEGEPDFAVQRDGRAYYCCGAKHQREFAQEQTSRITGWKSLGVAATWSAIADTAIGDAAMLRNELLVGYVLAGFAAALIPQQWLSHALQSVAAVPYLGFLLLLVVGLLIAVLTFVCSMGNVPVARFLANAGIPLGANTAFIYGDLLVPPLIAIYLKSFPKRIAWTFVALFTLGAVIAGGVMGAAIGGLFGGLSMGSMQLNDRITLVSNGAAVAALLAVAAAAARGRASAQGA